MLDVRREFGCGVHEDRVSHMFQREVEEDPDVGVSEGVVRDASFAVHLYYAVGAQEPEGMGDTRFAHFHHGGNIADAHAPRKQRNKNANPARLSEKAEYVSEVSDVFSRWHSLAHQGYLCRVYQPLRSALGNIVCGGESAIDLH
jgi:hypothetical protein